MPRVPPRDRALRRREREGLPSQHLGWTDLEPLVYINDLDLFTLPLSLRNFADAYGLPVWHLQLPATSLSVVPILIVYALAQRRIVESFATSGLKG